MIRGPIGLEAVDTDFGGGVQVPSGIGPEWFDMAAVAVGLAAEQLVATGRGGGIEAARWRLRRRDRQTDRTEEPEASPRAAPLSRPEISAQPELQRRKLMGRDQFTSVSAGCQISWRQVGPAACRRPERPDGARRPGDSHGRGSTFRYASCAGSSRSLFRFDLKHAAWRYAIF